MLTRPHTVIYLITDVIFSMAPIFFIHNLQRPMREKVVLGCVMALGLLCSVAIIPKLISLRKISSSPDFSYNAKDLLTWACIEFYVGIIAASIPVLRSCFEAGLRRLGFSVSSTIAAISKKDNQNSYWQQYELGSKGFGQESDTAVPNAAGRGFRARGTAANGFEGASERSLVGHDIEESWPDADGAEGKSRLNEKNILKTMDVEVATHSPTPSIRGVALGK
jgi:hypothetical protein